MRVFFTQDNLRYSDIYVVLFLSFISFKQITQQNEFLIALVNMEEQFVLSSFILSQTSYK